jgi:GTP-binding protein LepA
MSSLIRNFVVISHIDHGKSTLADRLLEITGTVPKRQLREQYLDQMDLERERGITIKMQPCRMIWRPNHSETRNSKPEIRNKFQIQNSKLQTNSFEFRASNLEFANSEQEFVLNLIDTPGHVDFSYEVSRSLAAVEGAVLLVDGTQGIQAQTLANLSLAKAEGLKIIGTINKIDLAIPDIDVLSKELAELIETDVSSILRVSGKTGQGVERLLEEIILKIPPAADDKNNPLRALIFDSHYDSFRGTIAYARVREGKLRKGDHLRLFSNGIDFEAMEIGYFKPNLEPCEELSAGEIGYIATGIKEPGKVRVGDTITIADNRGFQKTRIHADNIREDQRIDQRTSAFIEPLPGYREPQPLMFAGFYPPAEAEFESLRDAFAKLKLNDSSLTYAEERQAVLGKGFRAGFLGTLHMEIVKERLAREYSIEPLVTMPSVRYRLKLRNGAETEIETAQYLPPESEILEIQEPWAGGEALLPSEHLNAVISILREARGQSKSIKILERGRVMVYFEAPLAELIVGFYDKIKSVSRGYASAAYELINWRKGDLTKLEILIAGDSVEALARIVPRYDAERIGRATITKLKELLPREVFAVPLQAVAGGRIIARETIPAMRKDVTGHLYGGDRTRKMKLWKKQQAGKKRLAQTGRVALKPEIFFKLLKMESQ